MKRNVTLEQISDGRLYDANDLVKCDCHGCADCSDCCKGMGESVVLDPYDVYRLTNGLNKSFMDLIAGELISLSVIDGLILPHLNMNGNVCRFLNDEGRCSIHNIRPSICRLFPLGRYYENGDFKYFLQKGECLCENKTKIKVKKWVDEPDFAKHESFVNTWHYYLYEVAGKSVDLSQDKQKEVCIKILEVFFIRPYSSNFFEEFSERLNGSERTDLLQT
ncbi:MAG: YkgJ family cysteine cluster protein [Clostridiales bacterium]|nr:YkgJ family cysteine cluster protein [Clostridiales bacterium]